MMTPLSRMTWCRNQIKSGGLSLMWFVVCGYPLQALDLAPAQQLAIGRAVWRNECAGAVAGLTSWNVGEAFPSLGIGHFIWYPVGKRGPFAESWPVFVQFAIKSGVQPPAVAKGRCPWPDRETFIKQREGAAARELRQWLASHIALQARFLVERSEASLPRMMAALSRADAQVLKKRFLALAASSQGCYALIDYVNFKGEGIEPLERYRGEGWGLSQVLLAMRDMPPTRAAEEFSRASQRVLLRRIELSPPSRGEARWREGWMARCRTYAKPW